MQMPKWTAGLPLPGMGGALMLSALAHGLALAWWLHARQIEEGPPSVGQKRGSLTVTIAQAAQRPRAQVQPLAQPQVRAPSPAPGVLAMHATVEAKPHIGAQAAPPPEPPPPPASASPAADTSPAAAESAPSTAPQAPATAPAEAPGARFANLFAPIISRPLGRGRWQARPSAPALDETNAALQREQAIQGTRQALTHRVEALRQLLQQAPLLGRCALHISLAQQAARLDCTEQADLQRLSPQFGAILSLRRHGEPLQPDSCLQAQQAEIKWQGCPEAAGATVSSTAATP